jgi:hypothetical protein
MTRQSDLLKSAAEALEQGTSASRACVWCEHPIDRPEDAHPIMYARVPGEDENWQCADNTACDARQDRLDLRLGLTHPPAPSTLMLTGVTP